VERANGDCRARRSSPNGEQEEGDTQDEADAQPRKEGPLLLPLNPLLPGERILPGVTSGTEYPAPSTAARRPASEAIPGRYSTLTVCAARLTDDVSTPGSLRSARSTRPTHEAHVIPATGVVHRASSSALRASSLGICPS